MSRNFFQIFALGHVISLINFSSFSGQRVTKVSNRYRPISFKRLFISDIRYIWDIFFKEVPSKKQLNFVKLRFHFQHRWKTDSESQNSLFNLRRTWHKSFLWHFLPRVNLRLRAVLLSSAKSVSWFQEKNSVKKKIVVSAPRLTSRVARGGLIPLSQ